MGDSEEVQFPLAGVDRSSPFVDSDPTTTRVGQNVRSLDTLLKRLRGGSRPGLSKYPAVQVPQGSTLIQLLGQVTLYDPAYTLGAFEDFDPDDQNNDPNYPDFFYPPGGSGFTPVPGMPAPPRRRVTVTLSTPVQTNGSNIIVTAVLSVYTGGALVPDEELRLFTDPPGLDGHGDTGTTDGSGQVVFTVNEASYNGQVRYIVGHLYTYPLPP